jgi:hypothetical protein
MQYIEVPKLSIEERLRFVMDHLWKTAYMTF